MQSQIPCCVSILYTWEPQRNCCGVTESLFTPSVQSLREPDKSVSLCGNVAEILLFHAAPSPEFHIPYYSLFLLLSWTGSSVLLWPRSAEQLWHLSKWDQIKCGVSAPSALNIPWGILLPDQVCKEGATLIRHVPETDRSWLTSERNSWSWDQARDTIIRYGQGEVMRGAWKESGQTRCVG